MDSNPICMNCRILLWFPSTCQPPFASIRRHNGIIIPRSRYYYEISIYSRLVSILFINISSLFCKDIPWDENKLWLLDMEFIRKRNKLLKFHLLLFHFIPFLTTYIDRFLMLPLTAQHQQTCTNIPSICSPDGNATTLRNGGLIID